MRYNGLKGKSDREQREMKIGGRGKGCWGDSRIAIGHGGKFFDVSCEKA